MKKIVIGLTLALPITGCTLTSVMNKQTPLQLQAVQSREYDANKSVTFAATMSVLQDLGYIIQSADKDTGFITANSAATDSTNFIEALGGFTSSTVTRVTVFVEELRPGMTKVRLNFVNHEASSGSYGKNSNRDTPITDPMTYNNALEKIEDAIFVRKR